MNSVNDLSDVIFELLRKDTAQKEKSDLRKMLADLRAESWRLELLDVEGTSKKQKVEAQLTAIAAEISELSEQMKESNAVAATPPRRNAYDKRGF